jgi:Transposase IS116/IS110/IS902 family./Transposase.
VSSVPQEIPDEEHEQILERVCAIDVAKASGMVCTRLPRRGGKPGSRVSRVWEVSATTRSVMELAAQLVELEVQKVTVESTSDYWRIWFYLLEAAGLDVQLVNARDARNVPGRPKTDKLDSVWDAKLTERGMLRPSFVPPAAIRQLRDYTRLRVDLTRERTRHYQRLEKLLEDALIKVTSVASTIETMSVRDMLEALIAGERDPKVLARLARGRMKAKHAALVEALTGRFDDHHGELARILLDQIDALTRQIDQLTTRIDELIAELPEASAPEPRDPSGEGTAVLVDPLTGEILAPEPGGPTGDRATPVVGQPRQHPGDRAALSAIKRLDEIPGIDVRGAQIILAEVGLDMSVFATADHLASWAKVTPRTIQSGAKSRGGKTGKGNPYLKGLLGEAAAAAAKTQTFLGERYRRLVKRRGKLKALVAVARSILVIVWHLLADPTTRFQDLGPDYYTGRLDQKRKIRNHVRQLEALGYSVTLNPVAA